ncbi:MAG TPA: hypothetical protein VLB27_08410 [candidate division Zixibacteria bacterium]|nr:hypothetical protein [candidate division Zixibacteria bacterium]
MNEKTRKVILLVALVAVCAWGYANYPWQRRQDARPEPALASVTPAQAPTPPVVAQVTDSDLAALRDRQWGRDPFYTPGKVKSGSGRAATPAQRYTVKAILYSDTAPSAYINGRVALVGDVVDGATVQSISRSAVQLLRGDETITVGIKR